MYKVQDIVIETGTNSLRALQKQYDMIGFCTETVLVMSETGK